MQFSLQAEGYLLITGRWGEVQAAKRAFTDTERSFTHYWWAEVGLPESPVPLTGDLPGWELPHSCFLHDGRHQHCRKGAHRQRVVNENPGSLPSLPDPTPREEKLQAHRCSMVRLKLSLCWHESEIGSHSFSVVSGCSRNLFSKSFTLHQIYGLSLWSLG